MRCHAIHVAPDSSERRPQSEAEGENYGLKKHRALTTLHTIAFFVMISAEYRQTFAWTSVPLPAHFAAAVGIVLRAFSPLTLLLRAARVVFWHTSLRTGSDREMWPTNTPSAQWSPTSSSSGHVADLPLVLRRTWALACAQAVKPPVPTPGLHLQQQRAARGGCWWYMWHAGCGHVACGAAGCCARWCVFFYLNFDVAPLSLRLAKTDSGAILPTDFFSRRRNGKQKKTQAEPVGRPWFGFIIYSGL
jgi:hypothetical protein